MTSSAPPLPIGSGSAGASSGLQIGAQVILADGQEAELRFLADFFRIEHGCLIIFRAAPETSGEPSPIASFSEGAWRGAWIIDPATGNPIGLDPLSKPQSAQGDLRSLSQMRSALSGKPYPGLPALSAEIELSSADTERIALFAMQERFIDPSLFADASIQDLLDKRKPEIDSFRREGSPESRNPRQLLASIRSIPDLSGVDLLQFRVWVSRQKKPNPAD